MIVPNLIKAVEEGMKVHTMINVKEARELVEQSESVLQKRLDRIDALIRTEASLGKRELLLKEYLYREEWMKVEKQPFYEPEFTPTQRLVKDDLEMMGFNVDIKGYPVTIGGGLGSMDEEPREGTSYAIRVRW
jgi:hypothetical protein